MKVIGYGVESVLLEATPDEVAKVLGFAWFNHPACDTALRVAGALTPDGRNLKIGATIPVNDIFKRLSDLRSKEDEAKKAAASLRALADLMDGNLPTVVVDAGAS